MSHPPIRWLTTLMVLLGVPVLSSWGCAPPQAEPPSETVVAPVEQAVRSVLESYYAAFSDRDWPRFTEHFWPGASLTTVWIPEGETAERVVATSVPDFVRQAPLGPGSRSLFEERLVDARITVAGDLAQAWVAYHARFGDPGDMMEWNGIDAFTLLRHDGEWRITSLAYAPTEDPAG